MTRKKTKRMLYHFKHESCEGEEMIESQEMVKHTPEQPVMFGKANGYGNEKLQVNL